MPPLQGRPRTRIKTGVADRHALAPRAGGGQGGVGWRDNTLHVVLMAGDIQAASPFKRGSPIPAVVAGRPGVGRDIPIRFLRSGDMELDEYWEKVPASDPELPFPLYYDWEEVDLTPEIIATLDQGSMIEEQMDEEGAMVEWFPAHHRHGYAGDYWVAPENAATVVETLQALWDNDIYVLGMHTGTGWQPTYDEFMAEFSPSTSPHLDGTDSPRLFYTAVAFLTGAITERLTGFMPGVTPGPRAMSYRVVDVAAPNDIVLDIRDLNTRTLNAPRLDIAVLRDDTGSFGGSSQVNDAFEAIVNALLADGWDLQVAYSVFSEYGHLHLPIAMGSTDELPYQLIFPLVRVVADQGQEIVPWYEFVPHETPMTVRQMSEIMDFAFTTGGGGDGPETNWEGLYQIATGAGLDGNGDGDTTDGGEAAVSGWWVQLPETEDEFDFDIYDRDIWAPTLSQGVGFSFPGSSGDIPAYGYGVRGLRGATTIRSQTVGLRSRQLPSGVGR